MKATKTIVLYRNNEFIAEVYAGETYLIPSDVMIFEGTKSEFLAVFPQVESEQFDNFEEL